MLNRRDDQNEAKKMVLFCVAAASMVLLLFLVVLYMHDSKNATKYAVKQEQEKSNDEPDIEVGKSNIVSSDLDFWEMYDKDIIPKEEEEESEEKEKNKIDSKKIAADIAASSSAKAKKQSEDAADASMNKNTKEKDEMDDGKHIKITGSDGKPVWVEILEDFKKNNYNFEEYLAFDNGLLKYNSSDIKSIAGVDISSYDGTVDFSKVKNAGIGFVMIKVASRGYESGQINIDDKFVEYATGATAAGLPIGVYMCSQAVNDVEAVEEANYAVAASNNYGVKYPVAIDLSLVTNDKARTDRMTSAERTAVVKKFCETVKSYGRTPIICASRDFLISKLDLLDLKDYDFWLKDEAVTADYMRIEHVSDINEEDEEQDSSSNSSSSGSSSSSSSTSKSAKSSSASSSSSKSSSSSSVTQKEVELPDYIGTDYPYKFSMWQYTKKGTINGIDGAVNLNLSFVNYAER